jgi:amidohydrolase
MNGTYRTFRHEVRDLVDQRMRAIVTGIAEAMGCTATIKTGDQTEPVINHPDVARRVRDSFVRMGIDEGDFVYERTMGAEDVGVLMRDIPGMYFFVGSADASRGLNYPHHHPQFDFDEAVLPLAVSLLATAVADYVIPER